ncbi:CocE/NonD family hydrolase [Maledivibacter halophilus]|uniref:Putative hydrolase, CocE/NonD family n=1 Tax=Maledivibacter halophilus TaxID=36842 RepID=A0A1T5LBX6_9FIRM|nr:CocE/NonD family hydrolase [Maledivibacter halophilus]SKC73502.1 putative hydrolase, CocE/NonD family [Maledivibacter halophilus]
MKKILLALLVIGISVVMIAGFIPEKILMLPVGCAQNQSTYVTMKDGTKIAVRISLPYGMKKNDKVPTIMETTRYGTKYKKTFLLNALFNLGIGKEVESIFYETLLKSNYALIRVDARGSGASSGNRDMEWSKEEINDMNQIIEWITKQSWSNGKVGTYGISYSGNTAELAITNIQKKWSQPIRQWNECISQVGIYFSERLKEELSI